MAVEKLHEAITTHDDNMAEYNRKADACVERFSVFNEENIVGYEKLIDNLLARPSRV
jgi:hypothetical protein